ncbi:hypothetical protein [Pelagibacterium montanilacus]|uniref:hypothetical protein n=1 Tax=Pelagibacterium montanilacus TaxID=2185280 RepID=UPI000F8DD168|nr:hypothetical protein [Pelagibacterium montanilacus]
MTRSIAQGAGRGSGTTVWFGRSGQRYGLERVDATGATLMEGWFYVLAGDAVGWAGTAEDLIADQASRERFRRALAEGMAMYCLPDPGDDLSRMTLVWDLEGVRCPLVRSAA